MGHCLLRAPSERCGLAAGASFGYGHFNVVRPQQRKIACGLTASLVTDVSDPNLYPIKKWRLTKLVN